MRREAKQDAIQKAKENREPVVDNTKASLNLIRQIMDLRVSGLSIRESREV